MPVKLKKLKGGLMKHIDNYGVAKKDIARGFTEGRSESMIQEEEDRDFGQITKEEMLKGGFLGRGKTWER